MAEAVYNASGLGLPIVMTIGNRAIGAPINIWNDHSDSMSMLDSGWMQLHAENNQEAVDLHIQAFRLAEELSCPVMVCMDGFILTHAYDRIDIPLQHQVDEWLPAFEPRQILDPAAPVSIGAMVGPDAFMEVRYLQHHKQLQALERIPEISGDFFEKFGRESGGLLKPYRVDGADTVVVALGSVNGTIQEAVDELRADGVAIGSVSICSYRPFPLDAVARVLSGAKRVVVIEKSLAVGLGGMLATDVQMALSVRRPRVYTVIAGLGGRAITKLSLLKLFQQARADALESVTFLDLSWDIVNRHLARELATRRSGPAAEGILKDLGTLSSKIV
jgi:pyruvate ferredoxin oxidoreductase alpha subunit